MATVLGKTKTLDAEVIVRFTQSVNLARPQPMMAASAQQLSDLIHRRDIQVAEKHHRNAPSKFR
ncbi:MAG: hypothetical protein LVT47_06770 [Cyanobacteria bacterium LVE1205-1]